MFVYEKQLQYPVRIKNPNPALAKIIITQYGGAYSKSREKPIGTHRRAFFILNYYTRTRRLCQYQNAQSSVMPSAFALASRIRR